MNKKIFDTEKHRDGFDNSPVCAKIVDLDFNLQYMSQAGIDGLGIEDIRPFYGRRYPFEFYPKEFRVRMEAKLEWAAETGESNVMEGAVTDLQGNTRWYQSTITPVMSDSGTLDYFNVVSIDTTDRHLAEEALRDNRKKLKSLASDLVIAEERERKRIAMMLHDEVCQKLSDTYKILQVEGTSGDSEDKLGNARRLLSKAIEDLRTLSFDLNLGQISELGLEAILSDWLREQIGEAHGIETSFIDDGLPKPLEDHTLFLVFRSVRELLSNSAKYSQASHVELCILREGDQMVIRTDDNGIGFPAEDEEFQKNLSGQGLFSIRERMDDLGGEFTIESSPGQGCSATLRIPLSLIV